MRTRFCGLPVGDPRLSMALTTFFAAFILHSAENDVSSIQPRCFNSGDKKLRPIGIFATVRHRHGEFLVFQLKVFVGEFGAVNAMSSRAIVLGEVPALDHKTGNDPVKGRILDAKSLLMSAQCFEVLGCFWHYVAS